MTQIQNVSPLGAIEVPLLGRILDAGEIVDVSPEHADILLEQPGNYALVDQPTEKQQLQAQARELGLPATGTVAQRKARILDHATATNGASQ